MQKEGGRKKRHHRKGEEEKRGKAHKLITICQLIKNTYNGREHNCHSFSLLRNQRLFKSTNNRKGKRKKMAVRKKEVEEKE